MGRQHESLPPSMPTGLGLEYGLVSSALQELGYSTHAVGKWHLGYCAWDYTPTRRGFHTFFGFYTHGEDYYHRIVSDSRKVFRGYDLRHNETVTHEGEGEYSAHLFSRKAVEIIQSGGEKPLFLYLSFQSIHKPIQVPDHYARLHQPYGRLTKDSRRLGMISAMDEAVKNVTLALKASGRYKDTAIIFMSDNGGADRGSNWPLRGGKNSVWEGGTRSPAFLHYPAIKRRYRRRVSSELIHAVDWAPTILAMSGHPNHQLSPQCEGLSQWLALSGNLPGPRSELIYNINDALR